MPTFTIPAQLLLPAGTLLEGVMTTVGTNGAPHIAPMGPVVDATFSQLRLRPFQTSTTYANLKRTGRGIFHVTDDVELIARAAVGRLEQRPNVRLEESVDGFVLTDACRWYAFEIESLDDTAERTEIIASVVANDRTRDFFGFNRAKHAVVEASIVATRLEFLDMDSVLADFARFETIVNKTAGCQERRAFRFLSDYVENWIAQRAARSVAEVS